MSKTLSISIMKKEFQVACPDGEEEALQRAARYLSEQMEDIRKGGKVVGIDALSDQESISANINRVLTRTYS